MVRTDIVQLLSAIVDDEWAAPREEAGHGAAELLSLAADDEEDAKLSDGEEKRQSRCRANALKVLASYLGDGPIIIRPIGAELTIDHPGDGSIVVHGGVVERP